MYFPGRSACKGPGLGIWEKDVVVLGRPIREGTRVQGEERAESPLFFTPFVRSDWIISTKLFKNQAQVSGNAGVAYPSWDAPRYDAFHGSAPTLL